MQYFLKPIEKFLFYSALLFLPTQAGRHFWPPFSYVLGVRVDYLSPTLFFTDALIILLISIWAFPVFKKASFKLIVKNNWKIVLFFLFILTSIFLSKVPLLGLYGFLKLLEFTLFGLYTANKIQDRQFFSILTFLSLGILFESFLTIAQFIKQGSLGGVLYFFGERTFNSQTVGIANASLNGELILRPYGTFPHPNVLAGYLVVVMTLVISNFIHSASSGQEFQISNFKKALFIAALFIGSSALIFTMSRVAIILWGFVLITLLAKRRRRLLLVFVVFITSILIISSVYFRFLNLDVSEQAFSMRLGLIEKTFLIIKEHPLFGVGLNNFLIHLSNFQTTLGNTFFLQPVHNIFLLIAAETGVIGLIFFLWFIGKTYRRIMSYELGIILSLILALGFFDHYFVTLQQGQLLFSFILGLCWTKMSR